MAGTKIDQFLNIRHSKRFAEASPSVRETEVSLQLLSNHPASLLLSILVAKSSREAPKTRSRFQPLSSWSLLGSLPLVASYAGKEVCGSAWAPPKMPVQSVSFQYDCSNSVTWIPAGACPNRYGGGSLATRGEVCSVTMAAFSVEVHFGELGCGPADCGRVAALSPTPVSESVDWFCSL
jgi:hypothetical protein